MAATECTSDQINDALGRICENPEGITDMMSKISEDPDMMRNISSLIAANPQMKNMISSGGGNAQRAKKQISSMSKKERRDLQKQARKVKSLSHSNIGHIDAVRISMSRRLKNFKVPPSFPENTPFSEQEPVNVYTEGSYVIKLFHVGDNAGKNRYASRLTKKPIKGEPILVMFEDDKMTHMNVDRFKQFKS